MSTSNAARLRRVSAELSRHAVLSLDVFDTAVLRLVDFPEQVFQVVGRDYLSQEPQSEPFDFVAARVAAERRARLLAKARSGKDDVTLVEIYAEIAFPPGWAQDIVRDLEISAELSLTVANPGVLDLYARARALGLSVIFVSDNYLDEQVIAEILRLAGYGEDETVYTSGSRGVAKFTGRLYDLVLEELGAQPGRVLHVGDSRWADYFMARRKRLHALHLPAATNRSDRPRHGALGSDLSEVLVRGLVRAEHGRFAGSGHANAESEAAFWLQLGYDVGGPLLTGLAAWIMAQATARGCDHVYFFSRDGWVLKRIFERLEPEISSSYLFASRRALNFPAVRAVDRGTMRLLAHGDYARVSVATYLARLGLQPAQLEHEVRNAGFRTADQIVNSPWARRRLRELLVTLEPQIVSEAERESILLDAYLRQEGLLSHRRFAVVDIGWNGSLQAALDGWFKKHVPGSGPQMTGLYLATHSEALRFASSGCEMHGFLEDFGTSVRWDQLIRSNTEVLEFFFRAPHGSVGGFQEERGHMVPTLEPLDASAADLRRLSWVHSGALKFADDFKLASTTHPWMRISADVAGAPIERLLTRPTRREAELLGDLEEPRGYGTVRSAFAQPPRLRAALGSPLSLFQSYWRTVWPTGYRRRLIAPRLMWLGAEAAARMVLMTKRCVRRAASRVSG